MNEITFVERYGSFGVLIVLFFVFSYHVVPYAIRSFREICERFINTLQKEHEMRIQSEELMRSEIRQNTIASYKQSKKIKTLCETINDMRKEIADNCPKNPEPTNTVNKQ